MCLRHTAGGSAAGQPRAGPFRQRRVSLAPLQTLGGKRATRTPSSESSVGVLKVVSKCPDIIGAPPGSSRDAQSELPQHRPWPSAASGLAWPGPGIQDQLETMASSGRTVHPGKNSENPSWLALWSHREWCLPALPSTPRNVSVSNRSLGRNVAALPGSKELFWGLLCLPQALASGSP